MNTIETAVENIERITVTYEANEAYRWGLTEGLGAYFNHYLHEALEDIVWRALCDMKWGHTVHFDSSATEEQCAEFFQRLKRYAKLYLFS